VKVKNMSWVNEEVLIGVSIDGKPQSIFSKVEVAAVPCIFIHEEFKPVVSNELLLITHKPTLLIEHKIN